MPVLQHVLYLGATAVHSSAFAQMITGRHSTPRWQSSRPMTCRTRVGSPPGCAAITTPSSPGSLHDPQQLLLPGNPGWLDRPRHEATLLTASPAAGEQRP